MKITCAIIEEGVKHLDSRFLNLGCQHFTYAIILRDFLDKIQKTITFFPILAAY